MATKKRPPAEKSAKAKAAAPEPKRKGGRKRDEAKVDAFVERKARGESGREAAKNAGYGGTEASAKTQGSRLMDDPDIRTRVEARRAELLAAAQIDSAEVYGTFGLQMRGFDWADIFPDNPFVQHLKACGVSSSIVIRKMKFDPLTQRVTEIEATDPHKAAASLAKLMEDAGTLGKPKKPLTAEERAAELLDTVRLRLVKPA
jgi:hypothetical protein